MLASFSFRVSDYKVQVRIRYWERLMSTKIVPISVQLYSVREASAENFDQVLDIIARLGFKGVEPFHLFGKTLHDA